jgi:hypothetical protein
MDVVVDEDSAIKSIGDLYTYELTEVDAEHLQLGFLFATGAVIECEFKRMRFRRRNLHRQ